MSVMAQINNCALNSVVLIGLYFVFIHMRGVLCDLHHDKIEDDDGVGESHTMIQNQPQQDYGYLLCRKCGHEVGDAEFITDIKSSLAKARMNISIGGARRSLVQTFRNPQGVNFEVITLSKAHIEKPHTKYSADSFFPGFAWSFAKCPQCGAHLGWGFDAMTGAVFEVKQKFTSFVALILDKVMHEDDVLNLIARPKVYKS